MNSQLVREKADQQCILVVLSVMVRGQLHRLQVLY